MMLRLGRMGSKAMTGEDEVDVKQRCWEVE